LIELLDGYANLLSAIICLQLAGSDDNKTAIVQKGGLDRLIKLSSRFSDDPSVLQEVFD